MEENNQKRNVVSIDEAMNITSGTRKYQKIMTTILMLGPFTVAPTIVSSELLFSNSSSEFITSGFDCLDNLSKEEEIIYFRNFMLAGMILGSLFILYLADLHGRKRIIKLFCILNAFCLALVALSVNMLMLLIAGFSTGMCFVGVYVVGIVLCVESVDFKQRGWYLGLYLIAFFISPIVTILLSLLGINSRAIILFYSFLALIEYFLLRYVAESPRFLLVNIRNIEECKSVLNRISLMNGEGPFSYSLESENNRKNVLVSVKDIYRSRMNMIKLTACSIIWFSVLLSYYLTAFNMPKQKTEFVLENVSTNLAIVFSCVTAAHLINNYGRKTTLFFCLLIEGFLLLGISLANYKESDYYVFFILLVVLNFVVGLVLMLIAIFTAEQFPTYIRCTCFGISMMIGRIGIVIVTNIELNGFGDGDYIPTLVIGILILCISPIVRLLEETHHKELDEMAENTNSIPLLVKTRQ